MSNANDKSIKNPMEEGKQEGKQAAVETERVIREEIVIKPVGRISGFLAGMSKSMAASLAGIAGIAIGAGGAVLLKNHMDKKEATANLHADTAEDVPQHTEAA